MTITSVLIVEIPLQVMSIISFTGYAAVAVGFTTTRAIYPAPSPSCTTPGRASSPPRRVVPGRFFPSPSYASLAVLRTSISCARLIIDSVESYTPVGITSFLHIPRDHRHFIILHRSDGYHTTYISNDNEIGIGYSFNSRGVDIVTIFIIDRLDIILTAIHYIPLHLFTTL
jgi:hypothetical protein